MLGITKPFRAQLAIVRKGIVVIAEASSVVKLSFVTGFLENQVYLIWFSECALLVLAARSTPT